MGTELVALYNERCKADTDIVRHLPVLSDLAKEVGHVTEFGVRRGNSTIALLHGLSRHGCGTLVSYDISEHMLPDDMILPAGVAWTFNRADIAALTELEPTGMLFIDSLHQAEHVAKELAFAPAVWRYIAFHDTTTFAGHGQGDDGKMGICPAIFDFLVSDEGHWWHPHYHDRENNGLLVLRRIPE